MIATIKKARTCDGCTRSERFGACGLGYRTKTVKISPFFNLPVYGPDEPCPKPRTIREHLDTPTKAQRRTEP